MFRASVASVAALVLLTSVAPAGAQVVYNNFDVGDSYDANAGWFASGPGGVNQRIAQQFSPTGTGLLTSIEVAMDLVSLTAPNHFDLFLYDDVGGAPGSLLESWSVDGQMGPWPGVHAPVFVASGLNPLINMGSLYWLVADSTGSTDAAWMQNTVGDVGPIRWGPSGGPLTNGPLDLTLGTMRVTVRPSAVPEPSSMALLFGGGAGCIFMIRRRRKA
jgi:hypothetical protein